jgi:mannosyl-3-phosphoglycerate phosphatase
MAERLVLFTDLDGALLDVHTYSWQGAEEALEEIERRKIPLVFCTSKTRAEVEYLRAKMGNRDPFITENGGGIFIPYGYFNQPMTGAERAGHNHGFALGRPYAEIVEALEEISAESGTSVAGFHSMNAREIAANTGLSVEMAQLAAKREFDEPFFFAASTPASEQKFLEIARLRGLGVARGDRFWHLFSGSDKGQAVRKLADIFRKSMHGRIRVAAIGSSANDLPMLAAANIAVLLPSSSGQYDASLLKRIPSVRLAQLAGPAGWNAEAMRILGT